MSYVEILLTKLSAELDFQVLVLAPDFQLFRFRLCSGCALFKSY